MAKKSTSGKTLTAGEKTEILKTLSTRFSKNMKRHKGIDWSEVQTKLVGRPDKLWSLFEMEESGGEPDVIGLDKKTGHFIFCDCSPESPRGRRSLCYDREALDSRKEHKPKNSAMDMAAAMGVDILTEEEYTELQKIGEFDTATSSWIRTPDSVRELGGALFCDRRFNRVFVSHNTAPSYYASRGFRASLRV